MPAIAATSPSAPSDLAWRVVGLLNLYRLVVPLVLILLQVLAGPEWGLLSDRPRLFTAACIAYFTAAVLLIIARRLKWSSLRIVALVNAGVDAAALGLILYASGGVASGLGVLLVLPVLAMSVLADHRDALVIAAFAAIAVLLQQIMLGLYQAAPFADYTTAGALGVVLFAIALAAWPIANRLRESEALVRRQELDLANAAQVSQYIVQHLRESILVIDTHDRIRLINESAAEILDDSHAYPEALLGEASPRLLYLLEAWRQNEGRNAVFPDQDQTFVAADGARLIRAHFAPLGGTYPAPVLVFLEDTGLIGEKVQQTKLAALGRLSASIAHEIRNPVGAMSHAAQLLGESAALTEEERRLTEIMRNNAERVSGIINNVLSLSRRDAQQTAKISLAEWVEEFHAEYCETMQLSEHRLRVHGAPPGIEVSVDASQLRQIMWNLCENAFKHGVQDRVDEVVEIRCGRLPGSGRPFLEVLDSGPGVSPEQAERIFEPFYSGGRGTGLGLYLARELAQTNGATLLFEPRPRRGSIFRLVFADPRRWEV